MGRLLGLIFVLAACGSHTRAPANRIAIGNTAPDAGAVASATCGQGACKAGATCAYAGGTCTCGVPSYCGGAAPPEDYYNQPPSWQCTPTTPAVRGDGCPGAEPQTGASCAPDGKSCTYGDCCVSQATCSGGKWAVGQEECPP
jgi:hypothetical protein